MTGFADSGEQGLQAFQKMVQLGGKAGNFVFTIDADAEGQVTSGLCQTGDQFNQAVDAAGDRPADQNRAQGRKRNAGQHDQNNAHHAADQ